MAVLHHYSRIPGLQQLDPNKQGTGARGHENKHGVPDVRVTYFYREGTETEPDVVNQATTKYVVHTPDEHLYDIGTDPKGIIGSLREQSQNRQVNPGQVTRDDMLGAVRDAGHHGFFNSKSALPNAVGLFHPTQPHEEIDLKGQGMKKAQIDQGKSPEQKAQARSERNLRDADPKNLAPGERKEIQQGAPGRHGVKVHGDEIGASGVQRGKGTFVKPGAKDKHNNMMQESKAIKPKLSKDEDENDMEKSKNVREQRAKVFGTQSQPPKGSPMREKHMEHIRDYVKRKYGLELKSSGGKWDEETQGRRSDSPEVGVDKPDWRSGNLEAQDNPEAQVHELAHLEELPEGTDLPEGQRRMDQQYTDVQQNYGYMKQKRSQGEIQPMAMENPIRRRMGLPATDISVPVKPGEGPRTAVDTGGPAAIRVQEGNKQKDLIRQSRLRDPENVDKQRQIDEGILTWTDKGWAPGTTPDAKINARQFMQEQGADPVAANQIVAGSSPQKPEEQAFNAAYQEPEKMAANEGGEMDDETLRQLVKERFGVDLPEKQDDERIMRLAEKFAHGSARKPIAMCEAPDEAALPDLEKEKMAKTKGVHSQEMSHHFGKDKSGLIDRGVSVSGAKIRSARSVEDMDSAKNIHAQKLDELRAMPKPNLPKSEFIKKQDLLSWMI